MSDVKETTSTLKPIESFDLDSCHFESEKDGDQVNIIRSCQKGVWTEPSTSEYLAVIEEQRKLVTFFDNNRDAIRSVLKESGVQCKDVMTALKAFPMSENDHYKGWLNLVGETYIIPLEVGAKEYLIKVVDFHADGKLDEMEISHVYHEKGRVKEETLIEVSGRDFDPLFQGLIESLGKSCEQPLLGDPLKQSKLLEPHAVSRDPRCAEFPDMDPGFAIEGESTVGSRI